MNELYKVTTGHPSNLMATVAEVRSLIDHELYTLKCYITDTTVGDELRKLADELKDTMLLSLNIFQTRAYCPMIPYETGMIKEFDITMYHQLRKDVGAVIIKSAAHTINMFGFGPGGLVDRYNVESEDGDTDDETPDEYVLPVEMFVHNGIMGLFEKSTALNSTNTSWEPISGDALWNPDHEFTVDELIFNQGWQLARINYAFIVLTAIIDAIALQHHNEKQTSRSYSLCLSLCHRLRDARIAIMSTLALNSGAWELIEIVAGITADAHLLASRENRECYALAHLATETGSYPGSYLSGQNNKLEALIKSLV